MTVVRGDGEFQMLATAIREVVKSQKAKSQKKTKSKLKKYRLCNISIFGYVVEKDYSQDSK